jgi:signal transduction histidine kinase
VGDVRGGWPDVLLAVVVAGVAVGDALVAGAGWVDLLLILAGTLVLAVRRLAPRLVLLACLGFVLVYGTRVELGLFGAVPVLVALYTVVAAGHRVLAIAVAAPLAAGAVGTAVKAGTVTQEALLPVGWLVAAILFGELVRVAEQRALEAERTREEVASRRAAEERLRIARELHDSLTHSISVIKVQAGVAVHLARKRGEEVPEVLLAIQEASGDAARELRETLGALRVDGLARLPALLDRARRAGLDVTVTTGGHSRPLPADVDLAAYRIVQESLTNVTRHAGATSAAVTIDYGTRELTVRVDDDGAGDTAAEPGLGITGMRERVTALGGRLLAEGRHGGGFTVRADIPLGEDGS